MELLYKYYSNESNHAFQNLEKGQICFSPLEALNDPFEGVGAYSYQVSGEEQSYWDSIGSDLPKLLSKRLSDDFKEIANFKYRVFCSTAEYDNPLMCVYFGQTVRSFRIKRCEQFAGAVWRFG